MGHELRDCLGYRMRKISRIIDSYLKEMLVTYDITEKQMTIIFALKEMGEVEQGKLTKVLLLENSTVSRNIKLLHKLGLVKKSTDYRPKIALTPKGKTLTNELYPQWSKTMGLLFDKIGPDGLKNITELEKSLK